LIKSGKLADTGRFSFQEGKPGALKNAGQANDGPISRAGKRLHRGKAVGA